MRYSLRFMAVVGSIAAAACSEGDSVVDPLSHRPAPAVVTASEVLPDSVYWDENGVLELTDDNGDQWRAEREGPPQDPTSVTLYRNGVLLGVIDLPWSGSQRTEYTWDHPDPVDWVVTDQAGEALLTPYGAPSASGPCEPEVDPECVEPQAFTVFAMGGEDWDDCRLYQFEFEANAGIALTGAVATVSIVLIELSTKLPLHRIARRAAAYTFIFAARSLGNAREWLECLRKN